MRLICSTQTQSQILTKHHHSWDSGETYLLADQSIRAVVDKLAEGLDILTGFPVVSVEYSAGGALLRCADGRELRAKKVVITAPLKVGALCVCMCV